MNESLLPQVMWSFTIISLSYLFKVIYLVELASLYLKFYTELFYFFFTKNESLKINFLILNNHVNWIWNEIEYRWQGKLSEVKTLLLKLKVCKF